MTITTTHAASSTDAYSINFATLLPPGVALVGHEVATIGVTLVGHEVATIGVTLVSAARDGNRINAVVSGGSAGSRAQILMTGITDETPPRRHPRAICLQVAVVCVTEIDTP